MSYLRGLQRFTPLGLSKTQTPEPQRGIAVRLRKIHSYYCNNEFSYRIPFYDIVWRIHLIKKSLMWLIFSLQQKKTTPHKRTSNDIFFVKISSTAPSRKKIRN